MSKPCLLSSSNFKPKVFEKRQNKIILNTQSREQSTDPKKLQKSQILHFSPYASQSHYKSSEKTENPLQSHLKSSSKEKIASFKRKTPKNIHSLSSLIGEDRSHHLSRSKICRKIIKKLQDLYESPDYFDLYLDVFDEIITNDKEFSQVLSLLKIRISGIISFQKTEKENLKKTIKNLDLLNDSLKSESQKFAKQNKDLQQKVQDLNEKFTEISDKYFKLTNIELTETDVSLESLKKLKQENVIYQDLIFKMKEEILFYKRKSKKFCRLLNVLETKGVPVEEIYLTEMKKAKMLPKYLGNSEAESNTDNEYLESNRVLLDNRPACVPNLSVDKLLPESSSESVCSSGSATDRLMEI